MENILRRWRDNAPGSWFVTEECIVCGLCSDYAPNVFKLSEEGDHNIVFEQPKSGSDLKEATEAKEACPMDCIHIEEGTNGPNTDN